MKAVSLLQAEGSQAGTSCGELHAKKPEGGEGAVRLSAIQSGMERDGVGTGSRPKALFYLELMGYLHHSRSPRIMSKPDDSKRKQGVDENGA